MIAASPINLPLNFILLVQLLTHTHKSISLITLFIDSYYNFPSPSMLSEFT